MRPNMIWLCEIALAVALFGTADQTCCLESCCVEIARDCPDRRTMANFEPTVSAALKWHGISACVRTGPARLAGRQLLRFWFRGRGRVPSVSLYEHERPGTLNTLRASAVLQKCIQAVVARAHRFLPDYDNWYRTLSYSKCNNYGVALQWDATSMWSETISPQLGVCP